MSLLSRYMDEAYVTWLGGALSCCASHSGADAEQRPLRGAERPMIILHNQPRLVPPPIPAPQERPHTRSVSREWVTRTRSFASRASSRGSFSVKRRLNAYNGLGPRRPQISAPMDFRHVQNALGTRRDDSSFRPLELSIYMPQNHLSPLISHFGGDDETDSMVFEQDPRAVTHVRSESALSNFTTPRKPLNSHNSQYSVYGKIERNSAGDEWISHLRPRPSSPDSPSTQELLAALEEDLPTFPPRARLRSNTGPARILHADNQRVAKVKSILQEKFKLERRLRDIDSIIEERQSVYFSSRAGSVCAASVYGPSEDPMPMPDVRTSNLELMSRPKTAPTKPTVHIPVRAKSFEEASSAFERDEIPPPPLPLVLHQNRPPLRKKKSFSRVSSWLFPADHSRNVSMDSVTNMPKPITSREGFYQCVDPNATTRSASLDTVSTLSTMQSEFEEPTEGTVWTPDSSPGKEMKNEDLELTRVATFGDREKEEEQEGGIRVTHEFGARFQHRISSVGVAF